MSHRSERTEDIVPIVTGPDPKYALEMLYREGEGTGKPNPHKRERYELVVRGCTGLFWTGSVGELAEHYGPDQAGCYLSAEDGAWVRLDQVAVFRPAPLHP